LTDVKPQYVVFYPACFLKIATPVYTGKKKNTKIPAKMMKIGTNNRRAGHTHPLQLFFV